MASPLDSMVACLSQGNPVYLPSKFWDALNKKNLKQLESGGLRDFKRTIARNYFTFIVGRQDEQFKYLLEHTSSLSWPSILRWMWRHKYSARVLYKSLRLDAIPDLTREQQIELVIFTKMLWELARKVDSLKLLTR